MKKYILDYSTWRCGDDGVNKVGYGTTMLLNKEGYMCCLGQFCIQEGASKEKILEKAEPIDLGDYDEYERTRVKLNNKKPIK